MAPRNRRKADEITDTELQDTLFIRRLLIDKITVIEECLAHKCDSCKNTWVLRFVFAILIIMCLWIKVIQDVQATPQGFVIKAVADGAVKAFTGASQR